MTTMRVGRRVDGEGAGVAGVMYRCCMRRDVPLDWRRARRGREAGRPWMLSPDSDLLFLFSTFGVWPLAVKLSSGIRFHQIVKVSLLHSSSQLLLLLFAESSPSTVSLSVAATTPKNTKRCTPRNCRTNWGLARVRHRTVLRDSALRPRASSAEASRGLLRSFET